jgi:hypothetical protein
MSTAVPCTYDAAAVVIRVRKRAKLPTGEKADLVERFEAAGHRIHRHTELAVITPARTGARDLGFAQHLSHLGRSGAGDYA